MSQPTVVGIGGLTTRFKINRIPRKHTEVGWGGQVVKTRGVELSTTKRGSTPETVVVFLIGHPFDSGAP